MNEAMIAIKLLELALEASEGIDGLVTESERRSLQERIDRARAEIRRPIDTSEDDAARRARLDAVLRGER